MRGKVARRTFLGGLATASAAAGLTVPAGAQATAPEASAAPAGAPRGERRALILAGGANRGAYEAGVIGGLAARAGLTDGQPLGYEAICGTSIGAINGFFAATAQYTALRRLWREIAGANIFALKPRYAKVLVDSSGVVTRAYQGISLGFGVTKNVRGVLDRSRVDRFLAAAIDPTAPVHIPLYISTTNLTRRRGATFVRRATTPAGREIQQTNDALYNAFTHRALRPASDDIVVRVLTASAALPILLDPVQIPAADGGATEDYVDGGVTDNVPLDLARRLAAHLQIVLVDPVRSPADDAEYDSALEIGLGVFQTMQQRILEYQAILAIAESAVVSTPLTDLAGLVPLPIDPALIRPASALPGTFGDFNSLPDLDAMWERGYADGAQGFPVFDKTMLPPQLSAPT